MTKKLEPTLPDLLRDGLDIIFVGINPSLYPVQQGHYFAHKINRFWLSFSRSRLSLAARRGLPVKILEPHHDKFFARIWVRLYRSGEARDGECPRSSSR